MSSTGVLTGHNGKAVVGGTLITRLTGWRLNLSVGESAWGDSESGGYTNRSAARADATGTIMGKYDVTRRPYSVMLPGDRLTLALWNSRATDDYWAFPSVLIQSFDYEVNPDTCEVVGWQANFGADGIFYAPAASGAPDASGAPAYTLPTS